MSAVDEQFQQRLRARLDEDVRNRQQDSQAVIDTLRRRERRLLATGAVIALVMLALALVATWLFVSGSSHAESMGPVLNRDLFGMMLGFSPFILAFSGVSQFVLLLLRPDRS